jgi:hypothetical protein
MIYENCPALVIAHFCSLVYSQEKGVSMLAKKNLPVWQKKNREVLSVLQILVVL